jgi:uncharacterized protein with HEPN domain
MPNEDDARLKHIVDAAKEIEQFLTNKTEAQFRGDRLLLLGIQKLIEIIGEAANQLSDSLKQQHPHIGWRSAVSTRNRPPMAISILMRLLFGQQQHKLHGQIADGMQQRPSVLSRV